jgi:hypothetical protein
MDKTKLLVAFVLFLNLFFFRAFGSLFFVLLSLGFLLFQIALFGHKETLWAMRKTVVIFAGFFAAYSILLVFRGSRFVEIVLGLGNVVLIALFLSLLKDRLPFFRSLYELLVTPFNFGISYILGGVNVLSRIFSGTSHYKEKSTEKQQLSWFWIVKGLLIAFPIVYILVISLSLADPIFGSFTKPFTDFVTRLLSGGYYKEIVNRIIPSALAAIVVAPFIYFYTKKLSFKRPAFVSVFLGVKEMLIVMTLVALTLLSFVIIQWPYIFVNVPFETDLSKFGVATYSEYVKRGFVEFIFIALFVYGIIWAGLLAVRRSGESLRRILLSLQMFVLAEFFLILLSIFRRIYFYQLYHGLSLGRIYGGIFLLYIAFLAILLLLRHFRRVSLVKLEVAGLGCLILFIGLFNAESFIVSFHPPTVNKRVDFIYLSRLSPDGYNGWMEAYKHAQNILIGKGLDEKEIIGIDQRREVAYAGIILGNLTYQYDRFILQNGTKEEKRAYLRAIFESELKNQKGWYFGFEGNREKAIAEYFTRKIAQLNVSDPDFGSIVKDMIVYRNFGVYINFNSKDGPINMFYGFWLDGFAVRKSGSNATFLDRLYTFNLADRNAYEKLKKDIPIDQLVALQNQFRKLFEKIASQPNGERDYNTDISFQTPFL